MVFTLQFQQFSEARGQWLTDVLVVKDLKFWTVMRYIPRIIAWISPHQHISRRGIVQRVVWTQGIVDISVAHGQERTLLQPPATQLIKDQLKDTRLRLVA